LPYTVGFPIEQDSARRFLIRYAGVDELNGDRVFVADRQVFAAPWWSPHRFIYKAGAAEVHALGEVIDLTFERDVVGLVGLIVFDGLIGAAYGCLIGLIVAVLRGSGLPPLPQGKAPSRTRTASRGGPLNKPGSA
ncbi:MAG TPA: hypothetical protein VG845_13565, partial [Dehalococcoidia bacterium]|nr:hypothetical protein [Dehalococcoidia bacterium]